MHISCQSKNINTSERIFREYSSDGKVITDEGKTSSELQHYFRAALVSQLHSFQILVQNFLKLPKEYETVTISKISNTFQSFWNHRYIFGQFSLASFSNSK